MNVDELKSLLAEILEGSEQARTSEIATAITENYMQILADKTLLEADNEKLKQENAEVREQNMSLFLKVGTPPVEQVDEVIEEIIEDEIDYDDLIDENGNLI